MTYPISGKFSRILFQAKRVEQHCEGDAQRADKDRGMGTHHSGNCLDGWMDGFTSGYWCCHRSKDCSMAQTLPYAG